MAGALRTPLGRVRGRGSAKSGTGHFIGQRVSAVALMLIAPFLLIGAALHLQPGFEAARAWVAHPVNAIALILFIFLSVYHMVIGMQVIVEDYIEKAGTKIGLLILNTFIGLALAVTGGFAVLYIAFGG